MRTRYQPVSLILSPLRAISPICPLLVRQSPMMEEDFAQAVETGLKLAKRVIPGKDGGGAPAPRPQGMERSLQPAAPMVYAVIGDPAIVDNPDLPSYQPHVHGRLDPPALIPLHMSKVALEIDCYLDTAIVAMEGTWRVHCVMGSKSCDCRVVVPMGEQGSILGVEADVSKCSYYMEVTQIEENQAVNKISKDEIRAFLRPQIFSFTIPQVPGGSSISLKVKWVQKLFYRDGNFSIGIPFSFPEYVNPYGKVAKRERIKLTLNTGTEKEVICHESSYALKAIKSQSRSLLFSYEADVLTWSNMDFHFSFTVSCDDIFGSLILQSQPHHTSDSHDMEKREMFCLYLVPGAIKQRKVFRKEVVYIIDASESMRGKTLEKVTNSLSAAISDLAPGDSFNIIAFNDDTYSFSSSMELASSEMIKNATQWLNKNCVAGGGTNIMKPLNEAFSMLSGSGDVIPHIFLVTDGSVEDERNICSAVRTHVESKAPMAPRISAFGLGSFCNHYFLRMLAAIGRGQYDAAFTADSIETRMQGLFSRAMSSLLVNITVDEFEDIDAFELYPSPVPDLLADCPLLIWGRCSGSFPDSVKVRGITADNYNFMFDLNVLETKDIPLDKVVAKQEIDLLTSQAWHSGSKELEQKVIKISTQGSLISEYTRMILHQKEEKTLHSVHQETKVKLQKGSSTNHKLMLVGGTTMGFGNVNATVQNLPTGFGEVKLPETSVLFRNAVGCCSKVVDCCCCPCCISVCSAMNDKFMIVMAQLCTALSCLACVECCSEMCCDGSE